MTATPERRAELIAAAAADALTDDERRELDRARDVDPTIDLEVDELRALIGTVASAVPRWDASAPSDELRARVGRIGNSADEGVRPVGERTDGRAPAPASIGSAGSAGFGASVPPVTRIDDGRRSRRRWAGAAPVIAAAAAACLLLGFGVGALVLPRGGADAQADAPIGAPGELGARELVDFAGEPSGVRVDGSVVAHTWGTETFLEIEGLDVGSSYELVVVDDEGRAQPSGSFIGSTAVIDCRMNVATLRPDAVALEIRDASGATVAAASLPAARS